MDTISFLLRLLRIGDDFYVSVVVVVVIVVVVQ